MKTLLLSFVLLNSIWALGFCRSSADQIKVFPVTPIPQMTKVTTDKYAYISRVCAPWDGPALTILVTDTPQVCDDIKTPYFRVTIWKDISEVSGRTFTFPDEKLGNVSKQLTKDKYVVAKSGTVKFGKSSVKNEVIFEIDVEFEDGEKVRDVFKAKWCENKMSCG